MTDAAATPVETVQAFFADVAQRGPHPAYERWMATDVLWTNVGRPACHGPQEMIALEQRTGQELGFARWDAELRAIAADGDVVLTDRLDRIYDADGSVVLEIDVMGSLRVVDGRIAEWREYFDVEAIRAQVARHRAAAGDSF